MEYIQKPPDFLQYFVKTFLRKKQGFNFLQQFSPVTLDCLLIFLFFVSMACQMYKVWMTEILFLIQFVFKAKLLPNISLALF